MLPRPGWEKPRDSARANPTTDETRTIPGRAAVIRAAIARFTGDLERCVTMGRRALQLLPETEATARERAAARPTWLSYIK